MDFSRQEHWSRLPSPSPGDLPDAGIKPRSPALQADSLLTEQGSCIIGSYLNYRIAMTSLLPVGSGGTGGEEPDCQCRRHKRSRFDLWVGTIPWRRHGNPLQYSCLENPMDRGAWRAIFHRVEKSHTWLKWLSTHTCTLLPADTFTSGFIASIHGLLNYGSFSTVSSDPELPSLLPH